jgi:hypothetical protein
MLNLLVPFMALFLLPGNTHPANGTSGSGFELSIVRESDQEEKILYQVNICPGEFFRIAYTHSLEKCPIYEVFRVEANGSVTQTEEAYGWFAAGLEFNPETGFTDIGDHMVHIRGLERNLKEIPIRVGWICNFRLEYKDNVVPLTSLAPSGKLVWIRIIEAVNK